MESFLVFGRADYSEPLAELGSLAAQGPSEARSASLAQFGDEWVELSLVPESDAVWVLRDSGNGGSDADRD